MTREMKEKIWSILYVHGGSTLLDESVDKVIAIAEQYAAAQVAEKIQIIVDYRLEQYAESNAKLRDALEKVRNAFVESNGAKFIITNIKLSEIESILAETAVTI